MRVKALTQLSTLLLLMVCTLGTANATLMTYSVQAIGTGRLGGSNFTDALVTVTFTGDTEDVQLVGSVFVIFVNRAPVTVNVTGIGTATFTNSITVFSNPFGGFDGKGAAGIEDFKIQGNILDTGSSAFRFYDLKTAFGPVTGQALFNAGIQFPTTLGSFRLDRAGDSTFTATVGVVPSSQPVPTLSEWAMIGMGVLLAAAAGLRLHHHRDP